MRQYELAIRIAQIHHLLDEHKYKKALAVVRTIDMKQVKSPSDISAIADVFAKTEQYDSAKAAYLKIYNKSKTRRVLNRLIYLAIRTHEIEDAEKYYQEFVKMYPGTRDVLILRYRIDKAAGVPIGRLIEILEELKEEEYIEEWAYELAKLYHKAGRFEECRRECEDIILWFGHGEIVERAKRLIEYVDDKEAMPYLDDKDYTMKKDEPNPDDTGSLPDLKEYLKAKSFEDESYSRRQKEHNVVKQDIDNKNEDDLSSTQEEVTGNNKTNEQQDDEFIDDYDEDDFDIDADIGKIAKEGFQKLTGFLRFGSKKENNSKDNLKKENTEKIKDKESYNTKATEEAGSIDNAVNISESYAEEFIDSDIQDNNIGDDVAGGEKTRYNTGSETIEDIREDEETVIPQQTGYQKTNVNNIEVRVNLDAVNRLRNSTVRKEKKQTPVAPVHSQSGTWITQDLSREISAIYEEEQREQLKEKTVTVVHNKRPPERDATTVIERMTKAVKNDETKAITPIGRDEEKLREEERKREEERLREEEKKREEERLREEERKREEERLRKEEERKKEERKKEEERLREEEEKRREEERLREEERKKEEERLREEEERKREEERLREEERKKEEERLREEEERKKEEERLREEEERRKEEERLREEEERRKEEERLKEEEERRKEEERLKEEERKREEERLREEERKREEERLREEESQKVAGNGESILDSDLPTTRALHSSFDDILTLIGGEQDPSHFVFVGNSSELITGLSKRIIRVMKETGYMSVGRIAKISAEKLNSMDIGEFKDQLRGNCLLIDKAALLTVPTIAGVFGIMDEFYGDFVVILADEGTTLDQLFRFAPALARRFKYIIDISGYTEADCK